MYTLSDSDNDNDMHTIKAIDLCYLSAFVVSSQKCDAIWPLCFQSKQVCKSLQAIISSVYKVPLEEGKKGNIKNLKYYI